MDQRLFPSDFVDRFPNPFPPPFADAWGDDEHGLWAEFVFPPRGGSGSGPGVERLRRIAWYLSSGGLGGGMGGPWISPPLPPRGGSGGVVQRLRWIEPGRFLIGSPEDEPERDNDEEPQHLVTISRGFWLSDTACTEGLWQTVMGENPSRFMDSDLPVETVSWHDVQDFLRRLEGLVPGCRADLPTEAEWEYACRAGTTTPFSFGATITTDLVNYDGHYPYAGGAKEENRWFEVPVKSLPPNQWGLYEMHGNVWEWCADGLRTYDGEPQVDPRGSDDAGEWSHRACRGGSRFNDAGEVRSAFRLARHPGSADSSLGFRLCLRSIEPDRDRPEARPPR